MSGTADPSAPGNRLSTTETSHRHEQQPSVQFRPPILCNFTPPLTIAPVSTALAWTPAAAERRPALMATRTERSVFRTGATRGSTKGAHCRRDGIVRGTGPIHRGSEATDAIAARSHSCPRPMRPRRARIHGANAETPAASARMVRGHGEMGARPARTHMSRAELNPSTGQLADVPPRIDRRTDGMHRRIAGTLSALA